MPAAVTHSFFFNDTATTEIYTLSLHDALPILPQLAVFYRSHPHIRIRLSMTSAREMRHEGADRSEEHTSELHHSQISYAVFCLKKKRAYRRQITSNYAGKRIVIEAAEIDLLAT